MFISLKQYFGSIDFHTGLERKKNELKGDSIPDFNVSMSDLVFCAVY